MTLLALTILAIKQYLMAGARKDLGEDIGKYKHRSKPYPKPDVWHPPKILLASVVSFHAPIQA